MLLTYTCTPCSVGSLHVIAYMVALRTHLAGFTLGRVVTGLGITDEAAAIAAESVTLMTSTAPGYER